MKRVQLVPLRTDDDAASLPRRAPARRWRAGALALLGVACGQAPGSEDATTVTFHHDVAPIVYTSCAGCHRPGEAAPFSLLAHADVAKRARQIVEVVESRYMPPWLPSSELNDFVGDRSLSDEEIAVFRNWQAAGFPAGDPGDAPPPPQPSNPWALGEPDLVLRMPRDYALAPDGRDIYRNFVVPVPVDARHFVQAVDFRPTPRPAVHHLALFVDTSGRARAQDAASPEPGYEGMGAGNARLPDDQFVGWAPGKYPDPGEPDISWRLDPGMDLVVQMHMRPTGKREAVNVDVGLYFADAPPTRRPVSLQLMSRDIDIPAGESSYLVEDTYELPVDVELLRVYPHAHYLGKDLRGVATLPGGEVRTLVHIPTWDFNWQDQYRYSVPIALPRGSLLTMRYTYDNSASNPLNPHSPPRRVVFGPDSTDEMGELLLQVLCRDEDLPLLWRDFALASFERSLAYVERRAQAEPGDPRWQRALGNHRMRVGDAERAIESFERFAALVPEHPEPHYLLGHAQLVRGQVGLAIGSLERALELAPGYDAAEVELGDAYRRGGRVDQARAAYERVLARTPGEPVACNSLGELLLESGDRAGARASFETARGSAPDDTRTACNLARLALAEEAPQEAAREARRALAIYPDDVTALELLALALEASGERSEALRHATLALRLAPERLALAELVRRLERAE